MQPLLKDKNLPFRHFNYLKHLTDSTSIFQHAISGIPILDKGYSTDDAARALIVSSRFYNLFGLQEAKKLSSIYLNHLVHAQNEDGRFRNFLSHSHQWLDKKGTKDTQGRVIWGLGEASCTLDSNVKNLAKLMIKKCLPLIPEFKFIRPKAYALLGLCKIILYDKDCHELEYYKKMIKILANQLIINFKMSKTQSWHWYEPMLTYGNAKVSESLFLAYEILKDEEYLLVAKKSLDFLISILFRPKRKFFDLVGNKGWYKNDGIRALFSQQPIDAGYLVSACITAYRVTKDEKYKKYAEYAFEWFLGRNRINKMVIDLDSGCCFDGIEQTEISINNGAESIICYLLALLDIIEQ